MMLNELENLCGNIQKIAHISFSVNKMVNALCLNVVYDGRDTISLNF